MGGNAFPTLNTVRLPANEYFEFESYVMSHLKNRFLNVQFYSIPSYQNKTSFGDCDILFVPYEKRDYTKDFERILGSVKTLRNGPTTSFAVPWKGELFQVDMIQENWTTVDFARSYFAYNDLGNLLGRIFHRAGFKFGHKGLQFIVREDGNSSHVLKEITLTTYFDEALDFVGYDYKRWTQGFESLEDLFKFAISIPLANKVIFRLEETNHAARIRDRKRKTYQEFLRWVNDPKNGVSETEEISKQELRKFMLEKAFRCFPGFKDAYEHYQEKAKESKLAKEKFNGSLITEWTGLNGKELGDFISKFKYQVMGKNHTSWILPRSQDQIKEEVMRFLWSEKEC